MKLFNTILLSVLLFKSFNSEAHNEHKKALEFLDKIEIEKFPNDIYFDSEGKLWISSSKGVISYTGFQNTRYRTSDGLADDINFGVLEDQEGRLWFRSYSGQVSYRQNGKIFNASNDSLCKKLSFSSLIINIIENDGELVFVSQVNGIHILRDNELISIPIFGIRSSVVLPDHKLYVFQHKYLLCLDLKTQHIDTLSSENYSQKFIASTSLNNTLCYSFGTACYLTTGNKALRLFDLEDPKHEIVYLADHSEEFLLFGTRHGFGYYNKRTKEVVHRCILKMVNKIIVRDDEIWMSVVDLGVVKANSLDELFSKIIDSGNNVALSIDKEGKLWVGSYPGFVRVYKDSELVKKFNFNEPQDVIKQIVHTENGEVLVLGKLFLAVLKEGKVIRKYPFGGNELVYDHKQKKLWLRSVFLQEYTYTEGFLDLKPTKNYRQKIRDLELFKGQLYAAEGAKHLALVQSELKQIHTFPRPINHINGNRILLNNGEVYLVKNEKLIKLISLSSASANFYDIYEGNGYCVITSDEGLYLYKDRNGTLDFVSTRHIDEFFCGVLLEDKFYFGTRSYVANINIEQWAKDLKPSSTKLQWDSAVSSDLVWLPDSNLDLAYSSREFILYYSGIAFFNQPQVFYKVDQGEWHKTSNFYLPLQFEAGEHRVWIYAQNDNLPNEEAALTLKITIAKPFYLRTWFIILVFIVFSFAMLLWWQISKRKLQKEHLQKAKEQEKIIEKMQLKNEIMLLEQKALRMQMNPHFIFNAINTIKGLYAKGDRKEASNYIRTFAALLREILENEHFIQPLSKEIDIVSKYIVLNQVKFKELQFEVQLELSSDPENYLIPSLLLQPLVENAILHGIAPKGAGKVVLRVHELEEKLELIIEDDGVGMFEKEIDHESKSLEITKQRLKAFNNSDEPLIWLTSEPEVGTKVIIRTKFDRPEKK